MKQIDLAKKINVTRQTLKNWEKSKPELIRLIKIGIDADKRCLDFYKLFPAGSLGFFMLDNFYIDFYMRFLNYFRQNITNPHNIYNEDNTDINSTFIYYLIENNLNDLFDKKLNVNETVLRKFMRTEYQEPLCGVDVDLSAYILKNILDDFEMLIQDSMYKNNSNHDLFLYSLYFGVSYLIYKFESSLTFEKKSLKRNEIFNKIGINEYKQNPSNVSQDKIFKKYLKFREEYSKKNINQIEDELNLYRTNDFYIPTFILKLN